MAFTRPFREQTFDVTSMYCQSLRWDLFRECTNTWEGLDDWCWKIRWNDIHLFPLKNVPPDYYVLDVKCNNLGGFPERVESEWDHARKSIQKPSQLIASIFQSIHGRAQKGSQWLDFGDTDKFHSQFPLFFLMRFTVEGVQTALAIYSDVLTFMLAYLRLSAGWNFRKVILRDNELYGHDEVSYWTWLGLQSLPRASSLSHSDWEDSVANHCSRAIVDSEQVSISNLSRQFMILFLARNYSQRYIAMEKANTFCFNHQTSIPLGRRFVKWLTQHDKI